MLTPPPVPARHAFPPAALPVARAHVQAHSSHRKSSRFALCMIVVLIIGSLLATLFIDHKTSSHQIGLSSEQLNARIAQSAKDHGILDQLPQLQAIVKVESNGRSEDVFQSSESLGLPSNTLGVDASIDQGVSYYKSLLEKARQLGVDQDAVFQAYNYGSGYLDYVASHGGKHTPELAQAFSKAYSNGRIVTYPNPVAIETNGGWRYDYGNMFYVELIHEVL